MSKIRNYTDKKFNFKEVFDPETGFYMRSDDPSGNDPFMRSVPGLIDIGIMGHCEHGKSGLCLKAGVQCYQSGNHINEPNMPLEDYKNIITDTKDYIFQVALGGRGDPDMHENFEEILRYTRKNNVVPNFTTSGLGMTPEKAQICKKYCGAVAISMYSRLNTRPELALRRIHSENNKKVYNMVVDYFKKENHYLLKLNILDNDKEIINTECVLANKINGSIVIKDLINLVTTKYNNDLVIDVKEFNIDNNCIKFGRRKYNSKN